MKQIFNSFALLSYKFPEFKSEKRDLYRKVREWVLKNDYWNKTS